MGSNVYYHNNLALQEFAKTFNVVEGSKNKHTVKHIWKNMKLDNMKYKGKGSERS